MTSPLAGPDHDLAERRHLGNTDLQVTSICIGGGPLGGMNAVFGYDTPSEQAVATVLKAFASPFGFLDTAAGYSGGESERRMGAAIARAGGLPSNMVLATKVDPDPVTGEYTGASTRRSIEASLERLGVDRIELLHLHDPEQISFAAGMADDGPVAELVRMRDEGIAGHLGVAGGPPSVLMKYLETGVFEALLTHNRWTLADRTADALIDYAASNGIGIINAAPFGGGVLAQGTRNVDTYCYSPMSAETRAAIEAVSAVCEREAIPLGAAALQFSMRDPRITSTVVGVSKPERVAQTQQWAKFDIADSVWQEILAASGRDAGLPA